MTQAIIVIYTEDQNCPSRPLNRLYDIDEDGDCSGTLQQIFIDEAFMPLDDTDDIDITIEDTPNGAYGDVVVSAANEGVHMYVTFVRS